MGTNSRTRRAAHRRAARNVPFENPVVDDRSGQLVLTAIANAWANGWQPAELMRHVGRTTEAPVVRLALTAIAVDHESRPPSSIDPRWSAQLTELRLPHVGAGELPITQWARAEQLSDTERDGAIVALARALSVYRIPTLIPPPGADPAERSIIDLHVKTDDPILNRVRALLAQAESTQFEAEAETFTAKAQQLMTRHAIDMAMIAAGTQSSERPSSIRIAIDEPYVVPKSRLLHVVSKSTRCKAVFHPDYAMSSVVGFAHDLDATETLYTSLLVQAQVAMHAAAVSAAPGTQPRSRSFRSSFLTAYAVRVGERLADINERVATDADSETGHSVLPVLAARSSVVDATVDEMFGRLSRSSSRRGFDAAGWGSGRRAAEGARLGGGDRAQVAVSPG